MSEEIFDKIKKFVIKQTFDRNMTWTRDTVLQTEVGLRGDDAVEFIIAFGKLFSVDVSNFIAVNYFSPEGDTTIPDFIDWIRGKKKEPILPLTLGDLEKAVIAGKLDASVLGK